MSAVETGALREGQKEALEALHSVAQASDGALTVDLGYEQFDGELTVRVYLSATTLLLSTDGIELQEWEPIDLFIPEVFPYRPPIAWAARDDFPELPHQARGSGFCVRVEDSNWDPAAGIMGFLRAVIDTYQHIALGTLQGHLQPWRPLDYRFNAEGCAVIKVDLSATVKAGQEASIGCAVGVRVNEQRIDIVEWLDLDAAMATAAGADEFLAGELGRIKARTPDAFLVPAVIVAKSIALEYSDVWLELLLRLEEYDVDRNKLLSHLARLVTIGQPGSEGHEPTAVAFRLAADTGPSATGQDARFAAALLTQEDIRLLSDISTADRTSHSSKEMLAAFYLTPVRWARVYDGRSESVLRRAAARPTNKLVGAKVLLLGCGGLGAPIAEHCMRSGAARLHIVDSGTVNPGILSRQPFEDADIGKPKAGVLAERLGRIRPENEVTAAAADILHSGLFTDSDLGQYDLVIDATANRSVAATIERARRNNQDPWPTLITVAISQQATHGVAAVTPRGSVGAGIDLLRRLGLRTCTSTALRDVYEAFFPRDAEKLNFRPDTSCSDTTFIGSATDLGALAAQLLSSALARLDQQFGAISSSPPHRSLSIVRLGNDDDLRAALVVLDLPPDRLAADHRQVYQVRIDESAMETIREHVRASLNGRTPGAGHTGGLLLGQFDAACRIGWVSRASGLPQGSTASPLKINLNTDEVRAYLDDHSSRSGGLLTLIGFWHTHPSGSAAPSDTDKATMRELVASSEWPSTPALLLVLGLPDDGSASEPPSPWSPEIHAETFTISS